jgi:hypothetical protein
VRTEAKGSIHVPLGAELKRQLSSTPSCGWQPRPAGWLQLTLACEQLCRSRLACPGQPLPGPCLAAWLRAARLWLLPGCLLLPLSLDAFAFLLVGGPVCQLALAAAAGKGGQGYA